MSRFLPRAWFSYNTGQLLLPTSGHAAAWQIYYIARKYEKDTHVQAVLRIRRMARAGSPVAQAMRDSGFRCALVIALADGQTDEGLFSGNPSYLVGRANEENLQTVAP